MCETVLIPMRPVRARLARDGYAYLDDHGRLTTPIPRVGWYVSLDDAGEPVCLRLTDDPTDPYIETSLYVNTGEIDG